ncbi:mechanosensitive ion channel family protein [Aureivirga sp. CE67]|uniref:mechanosensitive ion channel family protein n=1 Tax=Aureivirga sp. CE67 TaxID=1788983 RepID=UPI0018C95226|nr:mechanosensitive ion channel domain-containing protein [Aureivirga sp. CE67]
MEKQIWDHWLDELLHIKFGIEKTTSIIIRDVFELLLFIFMCILVWRIAKKILHNVLPKAAQKTKTLLDDIFLSKHVINSIAHLFPAILVDIYAPVFFSKIPSAVPIVKGITDIFIVIVITEILMNFISAVKEIFEDNEKFKDKPIASIAQLLKIISFIIAAILSISIAINESPLILLSGLGAAAAVIMLAFKDSILGFVGSIQLSLNDMVRVGDWVTVPKYGADGDVLEINLTTIKVQNFDKTITTIPTYAFISDSFTNWRGMEESKGRRIKRAVSIKINSIVFCTDTMIERFKKIELISEFIAQKETEIKLFNQENQVDKKTSSINGRQMTNIGVFRAYLEAYLNRNPNIQKGMTCMVRQLPPTEKGIPIEVYAFSKDKNWVNYEGIIADVFDHIFAVVPEFDLEIFSAPSGNDFQSLKK